MTAITPDGYVWGDAENVSVLPPAWNPTGATADPGAILLGSVIDGIGRAVDAAQGTTRYTMSAPAPSSSSSSTRAGNGTQLLLLVGLAYLVLKG